MQYLGDFAEDVTLYFPWHSVDSDGASITRSTDGTISVYKDDGTTQSVAGITDTEDFDSLTGVHMLKIDTSADAFYAVGHDYSVVLSAATIDGQTVNAVLATFSIENRFAEVALSAQGKLDVNAEADTALTDYDAATGAEIAAVQSDTDDIQSRIPASLVGGRIDADMTAISGDSGAADKLEGELDGLLVGSSISGHYLWRGFGLTRTSTQLNLSSGGSTIDGVYVGSTLFIGTGTGAGQSRVITAYTASSKTITISPAFDTIPAGNSLLFILHSSSNMVSISGSEDAANKLEEFYSLFDTNTAESSADGTIVMPSTASPTDDFYNGSAIFILTGNGRGQARLITDYVGSSRTATITPDWTVQPTSAGVLIFPGHMDVAAWRLTQPNAMTSGLVNVDLERLRGTVPNILVSGRFDASVGAMAADVITAAALAADAATEIADALLKRDIDNVEAAAAVHSLSTAILKAVSRVDQAATTEKTYQTDGSTLKLTRVITEDDTLDPGSAGVGT